MIDKKLKMKFDDLRKQIKFYYEFPPLTKFNYKKRFNKILTNFDEKIPNKYNVKNPIFKKLKNNKKINNELNTQYSNICYINLK